MSVTQANADGRTRQTRGAARRREILAETASVLVARGYRGTSLSDIAERVNMSHQGLLYYFGTKDRLLQEAVAERGRVESDAIAAAFRSDDASISRLPDLLRAMAAQGATGRLFVVLAPENLDEADPLHGFFVDRYARARQLVADVVRGDIERGSLRRDIDVDQVAIEVVAVLLGLEVQWVMDPEQVDHVSAVETYAQDLVQQLATVTL